MTRADPQRDLFGNHQLLIFEHRNLAFIGRDHSGAVGFDDPLHQPIELRIKRVTFATVRYDNRFCLNRALIPGIFEHGPHQLEHVRGRFQRLQKGLKLFFDPITRNRLPGADTAARMTKHVRVELASAALRPAGGERAAAVGASDRAAQNEVCVQILAVWGFGGLSKALLNALEGFERDQGLVIALAARDVPERGFDIARIDRAGENVSDALRMNLAGRFVLREFRLAFKKALDLRLAGEPPASKAFESFGQD